MFSRTSKTAWVLQWGVVTYRMARWWPVRFWQSPTLLPRCQARNRQCLQSLRWPLVCYRPLCAPCSSSPYKSFALASSSVTYWNVSPNCLRHCISVMFCAWRSSPISDRQRTAHNNVTRISPNRHSTDTLASLLITHRLSVGFPLPAFRAPRNSPADMAPCVQAVCSTTRQALDLDSLPGQPQSLHPNTLAFRTAPAWLRGYPNSPLDCVLLIVDAD